MKLNKAYKSLVIAIALVIGSCVNKSPKVIASSEEKNQKLPYFNTADFTPVWDKGIHKIPDFSLTNQQNHIITNKTFEGKIYVADFFFTICPGICPKLTKHMRMLQETYKDDSEIMLLSHSVMPWHDTVTVLEKYAKKNHVDPSKWHLVTGNKKQIYDQARYGYFADQEFTKSKDEEDFVHTENFVLVDKKGYIRGVYNGTIAIDIQRLERHIKILKNEK